MVEPACSLGAQGNWSLSLIFKIVGKGNDARVGLTTPGAIRSNADIQAITFLISNSVHPVW
jgi:hypothetical protein